MAPFSEDESFLGLVGKQSRPIWPFIVFFFHVWQLCAAMMSWVGYLLKDSEAFILFSENSQILVKISDIPILLTFMYLVVLNLLVNNQLNSSLRHIIVTQYFR